MVAKTANVIARVEPEIREKAEEIMSQLGLPASVVINMLYKQIIMTKSFPFSLPIPTKPIALDEMDATLSLLDALEAAVVYGKRDQIHQLSQIDMQ
ncbi:hypothetical protein CWR48_05995 [Oceanobacillus arenosus]|uniref:Type II toxin-antitoxin system antitoxin, RelB/DinJ family n=1 Tax=Oceanobacillus arenosus TaxID=1229153 RepID=A0A3D8PWU9_9BACI|nr:type II toxin-antitoxin system RelB/DinJ family antitoxin [Oceanobacillus arenosus]RDW20252.1 hypothetical protein CWR48_05995 [Oceanobacillus arenosus]